MIDAKRRAIRWSLFVSCLMLVGKITAYLLTYSAALLSDAAESVVHIGATGLAAFSLWYAAQPADEDHPYGHGRIAFFSAGFEGALVFVAAIAVIFNAIRELWYGGKLQSPEIGIVAAAILAGINVVLGLYLLRVGKMANSVILTSNGRHVLSDAWTTGAALVGLLLVSLTGAEWLDPMAALLIGCLIMWSGWSLIRSAVAGLMDRVDPDMVQALSTVLDKAVEKDQLVAWHELRCRTVAHEVWVDVHMLVPNEMRTDEAHDRVNGVEESIRTLFPRRHVYITAHIEPADHVKAHPVGHPDAGDPFTEK